MKSKIPLHKKAKDRLSICIVSWLNTMAEEQVDFKWLGDNITELMTEAAWSVLMASVDVQEYLEHEGHLK